MNKILQFNTKKLITPPTLEESLENAWQEYQEGKFIDGNELMKRYGVEVDQIPHNKLF